MATVAAAIHLRVRLGLRRALEAAARTVKARAWVSPALDGWVTVCDEWLELAPGELDRLCAELSGAVPAPAIGMVLLDKDDPRLAIAVGERGAISARFELDDEARATPAQAAAVLPLCPRGTPRRRLEDVLVRSILPPELQGGPAEELEQIRRAIARQQGPPDASRVADLLDRVRADALRRAPRGERPDEEEIAAALRDALKRERALRDEHIGAMRALLPDLERAAARARPRAEPAGPIDVVGALDQLLGLDGRGWLSFSELDPECGMVDLAGREVPFRLVDGH
jgi:hypothetical protein